jgi:lipoprotein NlpI
MQIALLGLMLGLVLGLLTLVYSAAGGAEAPTSEEIVAEARTAIEQGDAAKALVLADRLIATDRKNPQSWFVRGLAHAALAKHVEAVADFTWVVTLDPKATVAYDLRGSEQFKQGQIAESIRDFDKYLSLAPEQEPHHWRRGISYYYAGKYDAGAKQFADYQTVENNDVENAVWRFLCMARGQGVEEARESLLKIKNDPRVPMMAIYALFAGRAKPDDVLAAARAGNPPSQQLRERLFYAALYIGLYCEATGDAAGAREHILMAADKYMVGGYMGDVARVHAARLRK